MTVNITNRTILRAILWVVAAITAYHFIGRVTHVLTLIFISTFVYSHYHRGRIKSNPKHHLKHFSNRVLFTYIFSFAIVALLLSVIKVAPWTTDFVLAFKRTIIVAFPCSMGAAIADVLK